MSSMHGSRIVISRLTRGKCACLPNYSSSITGGTSDREFEIDTVDSATTPHEI